MWWRRSALCLWGDGRSEQGRDERPTIPGPAECTNACHCRSSLRPAGGGAAPCPRRLPQELHHWAESKSAGSAGSSLNARETSAAVTASTLPAPEALRPACVASRSMLLAETVQNLSVVTDRLVCGCGNVEQNRHRLSLGTSRASCNENAFLLYKTYIFRAPSYSCLPIWTTRHCATHARRAARRDRRDAWTKRSARN
jgi:hypothetical protein